jgi:hypothetical protein
MAETIEELLAENGDVSVKELKHYGVKGMKWGVRKADGSGNFETLGMATLQGPSQAAVGLKTTAGSPKLDYNKKSYKEHLKALDSISKQLRSDKEGGMLHPNSNLKKFFESQKKFDKDKPMTEKEVRKYFDDVSSAMTRDAQKLAPSGTKVLVVNQGPGSAAVMFVGSPKEISQIAKSGRSVSHADTSSVAMAEIEFDLDERGLPFGVKDIVVLDRPALIHSELKHFGVKGMRWGVRRSDAELARAAVARGDRNPDSDGDGRISRKERKTANADAKVSEDSAKQMAKMKPGTVVTLESDQGNFKSMIKKQDGSWVDTDLSPAADKILASTKATYKDMTTEQLREAIAHQKAIDDYNATIAAGKDAALTRKLRIDQQKFDAAIKKMDYQKKIIELKQAKRKDSFSWRAATRLGGYAAAWAAFNKLNKDNQAGNLLALAFGTAGTSPLSYKGKRVAGVPISAKKKK